MAGVAFADSCSISNDTANCRDQPCEVSQARPNLSGDMVQSGTISSLQSHILPAATAPWRICPSTDSTQSPDIASVSGCGHSRKFRLANFFTSEYRAAHVTVLALKKDSRSARQIQSPDART